MCVISPGLRDLELGFANKRATSLPGDGGTEGIHSKKVNHMKPPDTGLESSSQKSRCAVQRRKFYVNLKGLHVFCYV